MPKPVVNARIYNNITPSGRIIQHDIWLNQSVRSSSNPTFGGLQVTGDAVIEGNLTVQGDTTILSTNVIQFEDNIILLNDNETGSGVTLNESGIEISRGALDNARFVWDESETLFKGGVIGSLKPFVPARNLVDQYISVYNEQDKTFETTDELTVPVKFTSDLTFSSTTGAIQVTGGIGVSQDIFANGRLHLLGLNYPNFSSLWTDTATNSLNLQSPQNINLLPANAINVPVNKRIYFGNTNSGIYGDGNSLFLESSDVTLLPNATVSFSNVTLNEFGTNLNINTPGGAVNIQDLDNSGDPVNLVSGIALGDATLVASGNGFSIDTPELSFARETKVLGAVLISKVRLGGDAPVTFITTGSIFSYPGGEVTSEIGSVTFNGAVTISDSGVAAPVFTGDVVTESISVTGTAGNKFVADLEQVDFYTDVLFNSTTDSFAPASGSAVFAGGVGIQKGLSIQGTASFFGGADAKNNRILNVAEPVLDTDAVNKGYVSFLQAGLQRLNIKESVQVGSKAEIDLPNAGPGDVIDGYTLVLGDRVLVKDQSDRVENGIYVLTTEGLERTPGLGLGTTAGGAFTFINFGDTLSSTGWICISEFQFETIGIHDVIFTQLTDLSKIEPGAGLVSDLNTLNVNVDGASIEIFGDALRLGSAGLGVGLTGGSGALVKTTADQSHVTKLGTVTNGVWNAGVIPSAYGGTGISAISTGNLFFGGSGEFTQSDLLSFGGESLSVPGIIISDVAFTQGGTISSSGQRINISSGSCEISGVVLVDSGSVSVTGDLSVSGGTTLGNVVASTIDVGVLSVPQVTGGTTFVNNVTMGGLSLTDGISVQGVTVSGIPEFENGLSILGLATFTSSSGNLVQTANTDYVFDAPSVKLPSVNFTPELVDFLGTTRNGSVFSFQLEAGTWYYLGESPLFASVRGNTVVNGRVNSETTVFKTFQEGTFVFSEVPETLFTTVTPIVNEGTGATPDGATSGFSGSSGFTSLQNGEFESTWTDVLRLGNGEAPPGVLFRLPETGVLSSPPKFAGVLPFQGAGEKVVLDSAASDVDGFYLNDLLTINSETVLIVGYIGSQRLAEIQKPFVVAPSENDTFEIHGDAFKAISFDTKFIVQDGITTEAIELTSTSSNSLNTPGGVSAQTVSSNEAETGTLLFTSATGGGLAIRDHVISSTGGEFRVSGGGELVLNSVGMGINCEAVTELTLVQDAVISSEAGGLSLSGNGGVVTVDSDVSFFSSGGNLEMQIGEGLVTAYNTFSSNVLLVNSTSNSGVTTGGAISVLGGGKFNKDVYIGGDLFVSGVVASESEVTTPVLVFEQEANCTFQDQSSTTLVKRNGRGNLTFSTSVVPVLPDLNTEIQVQVPDAPVFIKRTEVVAFATGYTGSDVIVLNNLIAVGVPGTSNVLLKFQSVNTEIHTLSVQIIYQLN